MSFCSTKDLLRSVLFVAGRILFLVFAALLQMISTITKHVMEITKATPLETIRIRNIIPSKAPLLSSLDGEVVVVMFSTTCKMTFGYLMVSYVLQYLIVPYLFIAVNAFCPTHLL